MLDLCKRQFKIAKILELFHELQNLAPGIIKSLNFHHQSNK